MSPKFIHFLSLLALASCALGCGNTVGSDDDSDTIPFSVEMDYPAEPHGFISSMVDNGNNYVWEGGGDVIPNICLPNQDDEVRCLGEYWQSAQTQILFVDFSAVWCPICRMAADEEATIVQSLGERDWNAEWITIIYEDDNFGRPEASDAAAWKSDHISSGDVLYDNLWTWHDKPWLDKRPGESRNGQPLIFVVDTSSMEIWYAFPGYSPEWATPDGADWFVDSFEQFSAL